MSQRYRNYIGVFDSGVGGISILKKMKELLPQEDFLFFGDSANAPYGEKTPGQVLALSERIARGMIDDGVKAIVIACNTATSAAAAYLRDSYPQLPIVGVEPAIKPAAEAFPNGRILVMATEITLELEKFRNLSKRLAGMADFIPVKCIGLAGRIEEGRLHDPDLMDLLHSLLDRYAGRVDAVVLGCTHYPFIADQIRQVLGDLPLFDSADGTARELRHVLEMRGLIKDAGSEGRTVLLSSRDTPEELELYRRFFKARIPY